MEKFFKLKENNTDAKTEFIAGLTTFMTMAYILIVNPSILSAAGMDQGAVFTATALSAVIATLIMGLYAKLPFAQAPGMGLNAFFAYTIVIQMGYSFEFALTAVLLEGIIFILLSLFKVREAVVDAIPINLKYAVTAGIGLFIAFIGFNGAGVVIENPDTMVAMGQVSPKMLIAMDGLCIIVILEKKKVKIEEFIIAKGINNIYYNNSTNLNQIIEKINELENNENYKEKILNKIIEKNKIKYLINNLIKKIIIKINKILQNKNKKNNKIISIIGPPKIGKTIFSLFLSLNIKNKKILLIDLDIEKNNIIKIIKNKEKNKKLDKDDFFSWKKNIDIMIINKEKFYQKNSEDEIFFIKQFDNLKRSYDYIIIDFGDIKDNVQLLKKIDIHIILVEANLLGIDDVRKILYNLAIKQKIQKDNIKIVFNKHSITSISDRILNKIFIDFEIFGYVHYDKYYNLFVNKKTEILTNRIKKEYQKIIKKLEE